MNNIQEISQTDFERIEKYLTNQMTGDEKISFEKELSNPSLKAKVDELKDIIEGIQKTEFKESLNRFHRELETKGKKGLGKIFTINWKSLSFAASVILIAVVSALLYNRPSAIERLFTSYYKTDPGLVTAMSTKNMNYEFERGMVDFKSGDFQLAVDRWKPLLTENPASDTLNYFMGTSYLELKNTTLAIPRLIKVTEVPHSKFISDAYWYLALAYILDDRKKDAILALNKTNHPLKTELLNKLGK